MAHIAARMASVRPPGAATSSSSSTSSAVVAAAKTIGKGTTRTTVAMAAHHGGCGGGYSRGMAHVSERRWISCPSSSSPSSSSSSSSHGRRNVVTVRAGAWPKDVAGVKSWKGIKFDEFSFEVKKCPDGQAAQRLVAEFCASDGLTQAFCESALDVTFLAYKQRRPDDEIMMLQELATLLMKEYRRKVSLPEHYFADEMLKMFTARDTAAAEAGDVDAARRLAGVRAEIRRYFIEGVVLPTTAGGGGDDDDDDDDKVEAPKVLSKSVFLTHLEKTKYRCKDDEKWEKSIALTGIDADELAVQEFMDPMDELRLSGEALRETYLRIEALQLMFQQEVYGSGVQP